MKTKRFALMAVVLAGLLAFTACGKTAETNTEPETKKVETQVVKKEVVKDLTTYVKGLKDWTVEVNAKNVDFMKDVTYDKKVVKDVTADASKVDLAKEGKYNLIYSIVPLDKTITTKTVTKTVTVKVVSVKQAQEEADKGNQVVTSDNVIKKDSKGNTPEPKEEPVANNSGSNGGNNSENSGNKNNNGSSNSNSSADNGNSNKPADPAPTPAPTPEPEKPAPHVHDFSIYVPEKSHVEEGTETYTEEVPVYNDVSWYACNKCNARFDNVEDCADHCQMVCGCGYNLQTEQVQTGTETVTKTRPTTKTVVDDPAHYECACGARQ